MWISRRRNKSLKREVERRKKDTICIWKIQEGKEETILTREKEETAEIIYLGETREEKDKTTEGRKEQIKVKNGEINKLGKVKEAKVEMDDKDSSFMSGFGDFLRTDDDTTSPLSIAVENGHFDIAQHILEKNYRF